MKAKHLKLATAMLAVTVSTSSCIGSFSLFNGIVKWEKQATNSKIMNEILFLILTPINAACGVADFIVVNAIEFWTDENPMDGVFGKTEQVKDQDGKMYAVKTLKNGYEITNPDGEKVYYIHDSKNDSWSIVQNNKKTELFRYNGDGTIQAIVNGHSMRITQDEAGLMQLRLAVDGSSYALR